MNYTSTPETVAHYKRPEIRAIIQRISSDQSISKAGNGDFSEWYRYDQGKRRLINLSVDEDYDYLTKHFRTLYWTLNYFLPAAWLRSGENLGTPVETMGYTLGVDIDKCEGCDIHDPVVKKAVEDLAQFLCNDLLRSQPKSVYAAFSGGGIYIYLHHKIWDSDFKLFREEEKERELSVLTKSFNLWIADKEQEFFNLHPECKVLVKADKLNNSKRVFKSLFSIHRKSPYAVIPLDPHKIEIDFEKAKLPLKEDVIKSAERWYSEYDENTPFAFVLGKYTTRAIANYEKREYRAKDGGIDILPEVVKDLKKFPPCIVKIIRTESMPVGGHRAIAFLSAFLGQGGWEKKNAKDFVMVFAKRWKAGGSEHIFNSWFKKMSCPSCEKIQEPGGTYPEMAMGDLDICAFCKNTKHPMQYVEDQIFESIREVANKKSECTDKKTGGTWVPVHRDEDLPHTWLPVESPKYTWLPVEPKQKKKMIWR